MIQTWKGTGCQGVQKSRRHWGTNPHEKEWTGNLKNYDKAPRVCQDFFRTPLSPTRLCLSDTHTLTTTMPPPHPYFWESNKPRHVVSDLGECSLLGAEPLAGMQEGLRTECYPAFISFANSSHFVCYSRVCVSLQWSDIGQLFERNFYVEKLSLCQIQRVTFIISVLGMPRQENCWEFEASLNYRSSLRRNKKKRNNNRIFPDQGVCSKRLTALLQFHRGAQCDIQNVKMEATVTQHCNSHSTRPVWLIINRWHYAMNAEPLV